MDWPKDALRYGVEKAREKGGEVIVLHIFNTELFFDYDAVPSAKEIARRESRGYVEEAKAILKESAGGVTASVYSGEGNPEEEVLSFAKAES